MPEFCLEAPPQFDLNLPAIELHHIREIRASVPSLANLLQVSDHLLNIAYLTSLGKRMYILQVYWYRTDLNFNHIFI